MSRRTLPLALLVAALGANCEAEPVSPSLGNADQAMRDLAAGKPLPGLPSLTRAVYVRSGEYVCSTGGALRNPDKPTLISIRACFVTSSRFRVRVLQPRDDQDYLESYVFKMVELTWTTGAMSDATVYSGWAYIPALEN